MSSEQSIEVELLKRAPWYYELRETWKVSASGMPCSECCSELMPVSYSRSRDGALESFAQECDLLAEQYKAAAEKARALKGDHP